MCKNLNKFEKFTLDIHLTSYPSDKSFDDIMKMIVNNDEDIIIWKDIEDVEPNEIVSKLKEFLSSLYELLK